MSSPRPGRLLIIAAATACVLVLAACGADGEPSGDPSPTGSGQGQFGEATATPTPDATTPPATATTTGGGGGGGGGDYGLAILQAIANVNDTRIVDLSSVNTAQYINAQNYKSKNGQWTHTDCGSGGTQQCSYYNQTGDIASVGVETSKLGQKSAVSYVNIQGSSFSTDAGGYVQAFIMYWINGSNVGMRAHSSGSVVSFVQGRPVPTGGFITAPTSCGSGRLCLDSGHELAGGQPFGNIIHWVVDQSKLGGPNAIVSASS
jgi:hypothetical protein